MDLRESFQAICARYEGSYNDLTVKMKEELTGNENLPHASFEKSNIETKEKYLRQARELKVKMIGELRTMVTQEEAQFSKNEQNKRLLVEEQILSTLEESLAYQVLLPLISASATVTGRQRFALFKYYFDKYRKNLDVLKLMEVFWRIANY